MVLTFKWPWNWSECQGHEYRKMTPTVIENPVCVFHLHLFWECEGCNFLLVQQIITNQRIDLSPFLPTGMSRSERTVNYWRKRYLSAISSMIVLRGNYVIPTLIEGSSIKVRIEWFSFRDEDESLKGTIMIKIMHVEFILIFRVMSAFQKFSRSLNFLQIDPIKLIFTCY